MAGPRVNLAVTKDGETYNKLQRPGDFLEKSAALVPANERKREHTTAGPASCNKRSKTQHSDSIANISQSPSDKHQYRSACPISECGMRMTLPIDEADEEYSDDSTGEALAYLRSVRSEASAIPHLLVASTTYDKDAENHFTQKVTSSTFQRVIYQDGAWISFGDGYETTHNKSNKSNVPSSQELYYKQLTKRFERLRKTLSRSRGHRLVHKSGAGAGRTSSVKPPLNRHEWLYILDREYPTLAQVSQLDEKDIRRGLEYCIHAMNRFDTISGQKSCWIWTLLALSSDIGTLDSRGMSHIRDLGNTASRLSIDLHQGIRHQKFEDMGDLLHSDSACDESKDNTEVSNIVLHNADGDGDSSKTDQVRFGDSEHSNSTTREMLSEPLTDSQNGLQSREINLEASNAGISGGTHTDTNENNLELARARLLAQLGDNLVQAGIPTSAHNTDGARAERSEQLHQYTDDPQHEIKPRIIPSRAEAERQRQMIRIRDSGAEISRESDTFSNDHPTVAEGHGSCAVDLNTRVTIDMILTVVAESYGQKDLLMSRKPW